MQEAREQRRRGRPRGAKTRQRLDVVVQTPCCPRCQGTQRTRLRLAADRRTRPRAGSGRRVRYYYTTCTHCGQPMRFVVFDPPGQ